MNLQPVDNNLTLETIARQRIIDHRIINRTQWRGTICKCDRCTEAEKVLWLLNPSWIRDAYKEGMTV